MLREIKDLSKGREPWVRRLNIVKMSVPPKLIYRFSGIPFKTQQAFFFFLVEIDKPFLKFIWTCKEPRIPKTTLKKKKVGEVRLISGLITGLQ